MIEEAMKKDGTASVANNNGNSSRKGSNFLKRKEKYDPKKALEKGQGTIQAKNIEKKRIFK
jgi:hypothetical protein